MLCGKTIVGEDRGQRTRAQAQPLEHLGAVFEMQVCPSLEMTLTQVISIPSLQGLHTLHSRGCVLELHPLVAQLLLPPDHLGDGLLSLPVLFELGPNLLAAPQELLVFLLLLARECDAHIGGRPLRSAQSFLFGAHRMLQCGRNTIVPHPFRLLENVSQYSQCSCF